MSDDRADGTARITASERARSKHLEAARLRALRFSLDQIAEQLGYLDRRSAWHAVKAGQELIVREPREDAVLLDLTELDEMARAAWTVLRNTHYVVDRGEVVRLDGTPLNDDAPVLAAIGRLLDIQARRAKLVGLDAPKRLEVSDNLPDLDRAVQDLAAELAIRAAEGRVPNE
jgi:hypothetical protein